MEWIRDYAILQTFEEKYRMEFSTIDLIVNRNADGDYYYIIIGKSRLTSKQTFSTAREAKAAAIDAAKYRMLTIVAKIHDLEVNE